MTATIQPTKEVISRREAAAYIGIGRTTLDRLDIPKIQIRKRVLFKKETIDTWLSQNQANKNQAKKRKHEPKQS
ncbi:MAG: DNA-binding protein [Treponema sp.]|jgi:excisionase family DNA binding protein|nr:DNA-binding protein [Treponema sp.]